MTDTKPTIENLETRLLLSTLDYARLMGGNAEDRVRDLAYQDGYVYASGVTYSMSFLGDAGSDADNFVAKMDPNGLDPAACPGGVCWSTRLVNSGSDRHRGVAVDASGNVFALSINDDTDQMSVHKLDPAGNRIFTQALGAVSPTTNLDMADLSFDGAGHLYVAGKTPDPGFFTVAEMDAFHGGGSDIFLGKYADTGTGLSLVYGTFIGGSKDDEVRRLAVHDDPAGGANVFIVGRTASANFPTTGGFDTSLRGTWDGYLVKLSSSGNVTYGTFFGGAEKDGGLRFEMATAIAVNAAGVAYVLGDTTAREFTTTAGAFDRTHNGGGDAFVAKINPSATGASSLLYSSFFGGTGDEPVHSLELDTGGDVYIAGRTFSKNLPTTPDAFQRVRKGPDDAFLARLRLAGAGSADLISSTYLGGAKADWGFAVAIESNTGGSIRAYVGGSTESTDFPKTTGPAHAGIYDSYLAVISFPASHAPAIAAAEEQIISDSASYEGVFSGGDEKPDGDVLT